MTTNDATIHAQSFSNAQLEQLARILVQVGLRISNEKSSSPEPQQVKRQAARCGSDGRRLKQSTTIAQVGKEQS